MGMTSAAEARLDARIRPEITVLRSRTPYPKRRPPAAQAARQWAPAEAGRHLTSVAPTRSAATDPAGWLAGEPAARLGTEPARRSEAEPARQSESGPPAQPGPIRLTRRGRIVVGALLVIGVVIMAGLVWLAASGRAQASNHTQSGQLSSHAMIRVVVQPGETLWSIAVRTDPAADPRVVISEIMNDNALTGTAIQAGQLLWVPRG